MSGPRLVTSLQAFVLAVLGVQLGVVGAFLVPGRLAGVPTGVLVAGVGNVVLAATARRLLPGTWLPALPAVVWLVTATYVGGARAEGDVIVPGDPAGIAFLLVGALAAGVGLRLTPRPAERTYSQEEDLPKEP